MGVHLKPWCAVPTLSPEAAVSRQRARASPPWPLEPMLATLSEELPRGGGWAFEFKWDGFRTLLWAEGGEARLQARSGRDVTADYPELHSLAQGLRGPTVLDGEVVVLDAKGRPTFEGMLRRSGYGGRWGLRAAKGKARQEPVVFVAFDVPWLDGRSLVDEPYTTRRAALEGLGLEGEACLVPAWHADGPAVQEASRELGLEGVVAKRLDSPYRPGQRSDAWRKVKNVHRQEFVVGGWVAQQGTRGRVGALLLGVHEGPRLVYAGRVGSGFTERVHEALAQALGPLRSKACPFDALPEAAPGAVWVRPLLVVEVAFRGWTGDGLLRNASFKGFRPDKDPEDVVREVHT